MHTFPYCPELTAAIILVSMADSIPKSKEDFERQLVPLLQDLPELKATATDGASDPTLDNLKEIAKHILQNSHDMAEPGQTLSDSNVITGVKSHFESTMKTLIMQKGGGGTAVQRIFYGNTTAES